MGKLKDLNDEMASRLIMYNSRITYCTNERELAYLTGRRAELQYWMGEVADILIEEEEANG